MGGGSRGKEELFPLPVPLYIITARTVHLYIMLVNTCNSSVGGGSRGKEELFPLPVPLYIITARTVHLYIMLVNTCNE